MKTSLIVTLLTGGLASLDATPVAQTLASQPLVTATILGAVWGDWSTAMAVGTVLQILAASTLPIGARTPEDYAVGGVVGAGVALLIAGQAPYEQVRQAAAFTGVMVGLLAATVGDPIVRWQRRRNEGLARWTESALRAGDERALGRAHLAAVAMAFAVGLAATALWCGLGAWLAPFVTRESLRLAGAWHLLQPLWLGFGVAQLLHAFVQRRLTRAGVFAVSLVAAWLTFVAGTP